MSTRKTRSNFPQREKQLHADRKTVHAMFRIPDPTENDEYQKTLRRAAYKP